MLFNNSSTDYRAIDEKEQDDRLSCIVYVFQNLMARNFSKLFLCFLGEIAAVDKSSLMGQNFFKCETRRFLIVYIKVKMCTDPFSPFIKYNKFLKKFEFFLTVIFIWRTNFCWRIFVKTTRDSLYCFEIFFTKNQG